LLTLDPRRLARSVLYERDEENIACFMQLAGVSSFAQLSIGVRIGPPPPPRTRPQCAGATWIVPRYDGGQLFARYWNGDPGRLEHDHRWDHDRDRDVGHDHHWEYRRTNARNMNAGSIVNPALYSMRTENNVAFLRGEALRARRTFFVMKILLLSAVVSVSAFAATFGTCAPTTLDNLIGNPCGLGDKMFSNFAYSGNVAASNVSVDFEMVGTEFHLILAPVTGTGFFTNLSLSDTISVMSGVAPNIPPANYQIVGVKDQSNFSGMPGSSGLLDIVNTPGPAYGLIPGSEDGGPTFFAGTTTVTTVSTLTGLGGTGNANPGLASLELDYIQANTAIPEPASFALIGAGLMCLGLLRKRAVNS
jgi:hypothetical protein